MNNVAATMQIIAHRGASHDAPENTLAAVRLAWAQHADALEIDVHLTRDHRLAVIHDPDTRRTAGTARIVADSTLAELQRLDAGRWKDRRFAGEKIPALEEVLALVPPGRHVFIELKGGPEIVPALARCLADSACDRARVAVIGFDFRTVLAAKRVLLMWPVCWLQEHDPQAPSTELERLIEHCRVFGLDGLDLEAAWPIDADVVRRVHRAGLKLFVWTVDDPAVARKLAQAGVDGIATNRPGWLRAQLEA